jgi:hypothetical protein
MKIVPLFTPLKSIAAGLLALLAVSASAQIGGSGWTPQTVTFNVQWPYNLAESTRYSFTDGVYHMLVHSDDQPFEKGNTTRPRTEQRFNPDFTGGDIQYQAMLMAPADENSYCIMQDHTGDAQSPAYGPVAIMFIWQSKDGGSIWNGYTGHELAENLGGQWFQLNVDHNVVTHTIKAWINQQLVVTEQDNGATDYYFKDGVYEQDISTPSSQMDTYAKDIQIWTSSGKGATSTVGDPAFSPGGGAYTSTQIVSITSATSGASFRYTTDGSTPSETAGMIYSGAVSISSTTTLKAIAYKSGSTDSATYTITIAPPPTLNFEAESLSYTPNGATASVQTDTNSSGGKWVELAGNSVGDYINFTVPSVPAGTYQLKMEWKGNTTRGILQLSVDGTKLGATLDQYATGQSYPTTTFGNVTFATAGSHAIRLTVTGKNKSSSSYQLSADKFTFVGQ